MSVTVGRGWCGKKLVTKVLCGPMLLTTVPEGKTLETTVPVGKKLENTVPEATGQNADEKTEVGWAEVMDTGVPVTVTGGEAEMVTGSPDPTGKNVLVTGPVPEAVALANEVHKYTKAASYKMAALGELTEGCTTAGRWEGSRLR